MSRRSTLEEKLIAVSALDPHTPQGLQGLRAALRRRESHLVARAAEIVGRAGIDGFDAELNTSLDRFYRSPVRTDPSCAAKLALLTALDRLDHPDPAPFFRAAAHIQLEPAWGPPVDTAAALRSRAVLAVGRSASDDALLVLGSALADPEPPVRRAAVESLLSRGDGASAALLAMRVRLEDEDPVVQAESMAALVRLAPAYGMRILVPKLESSDATVQELAAMALGESRNPSALQALIRWLDRTVLAAQRAVGIAAIGAHRSEGAREFLLEQVEEGATADARLAAEVLIQQGTPIEAVTEAAEGRNDVLDFIVTIELQGI